MKWFRNFMYGRYGADQLGNFLFVFYIILAILSFVYPPIMILCYATIIYSLFRMFSKQYYKRRAENEWYLNKTEGIRKFFNRQKNQWALPPSTTPNKPALGPAALTSAPETA